MVLTGFRFNPTDEELIEILNQKISGNIVAPSDFIVETDIYEVEPQHLQWNESVAVNKNERYYFCKREMDSREVTGRGWWKATSHVKTISSASNEGLVGYKRPLTFHKFRSSDHIHNQRKRKDAIKTDWIMHEYGLQSIPTKWKLCKIKYKGKEDMMMMMENNYVRSNTSSSPMISSSELAGNFSSSTSTNPTNMRVFDEMIGDHDHQFQPCSSPFVFDDPSYYSMPFSYDHFAQLHNQAQQPFADLWS